ncbi:hypothetical protein OROHE_023708 [Orobanche hederae]
MAGWVLLMMAVVVGLAAAATASSLSADEFQGVLALERAFPLGERVELEAIEDRDRARHARILQSFSGGIVDFPVGGTSDPYAVGLYYTKVRLGSPPQEFNVQIDTGSDILWVTCSSCNNCPRNSGLGIALNFFDPATSSTVSSISCSDRTCASIVQTASAECSTDNTQCDYSFHYGDGSGTSGFYVSDVLYFDSILGASLIANSSTPIVFGCSTSMSGDLTKSDRAVDGIFGFGRQGLSVISQLASLGITPRIFSHCLKGDGSGGGILVLGQIMDPGIVYTPLVPSQEKIKDTVKYLMTSAISVRSTNTKCRVPHYNVYLQNIAVNGQLLPIDQAVFTTSGNRGTIIDSGTTLAYLVEGAYDPLVTAITNAVSPPVIPIISRGNQCYLATTSVSEPIDYLVHTGFVDGAAMWCMGFIKVPSKGTTILGDLVLKDKIFVYDLAHQRIGWADYEFFIRECLLDFR